MPVDVKELERFARTLMRTESRGHFETLGMELDCIAFDRARMQMACRPETVGDPDTGVIHGGAITALLDTCSGFAAATRLDELGMAPTIDLRIDYMCSATPGQAVIAEAEVYRVTDYVVFTRAVAHHGDTERPIAFAVGNFFRTDSGVFTQVRDDFRAGVPLQSALDAEKGATQ